MITYNDIICMEIACWIKKMMHSNCLCEHYSLSYMISFTYPFFQSFICVIYILGHQEETNINYNSKT